MKRRYLKRKIGNDKKIFAVNTIRDIMKMSTQLLFLNEKVTAS